jgi:hypothetical protein
VQPTKDNLSQHSCDDFISTCLETGRHDTSATQSNIPIMATNQVPQKLVNESVIEFLTTEMVEAMIRTIKDDALKLGSDRDPSHGSPSDAAGGPKDYSEGDEEMEAVYYKLEMIGFRVGERLIERQVHDIAVNAFASRQGAIAHP